MGAERPPLLVLVGATAVGKTAVAIELARELGGELVGADSVQVYRGLDVGSSKPTASELGTVAHHLIDVAEPDAPLDAARYATLADGAIESVRGRGALPIVVGGTGLWLRALLRGLVELPPVDQELRDRLQTRWNEEGPEAMHSELHEIDPLAAQAIHPNDMVRTVRALEIHAQTGRPIGELRAEHALGAPRYPATMVQLDVDRTHWKQFVQTRSEAMLNAGWLEEVRTLRARYGDSIRALHAVGYRQVVEHLRDGVSMQDTREAIVRATLRYGKRQRNWFAADRDVVWRCTPAELVSRAGLTRLREQVDRGGTLES